MAEPKKILLQTTIPTTKDDWSIARFSSLASLLRDARDQSGNALYDVTARDRDPPGKPDSVLSTIDLSDFDELWLFAVDTGDGLTEEDCAPRPPKVQTDEPRSIRGVSSRFSVGRSQLPR